MEAKAAVKVVALSACALALGALLYLYLAHFNNNSYLVRVVFEDTQGLLRQSVVRMQGVGIGEVKKIQLDTRRNPVQAVVTLQIDRNYSIPRDYRFVIISGLLISNPQLEVQPPANPNPGIGFLPKNNTAVVMGAPSPGMLTSLSPDLARSVSSLTGTVQDLQARLDTLSSRMNTVAGHADKLMVTSTQTVEAAKELIADPRLHEDLVATMGNFRLASQNVVVTSRDLGQQLTAFMRTGRSKFDRLSNTAIDLTSKVGATVDDVRAILNRLQEQVSDPRLQRSLIETVDLARATLASVRQITSDIHQITGDPSLPANVHATLSNVTAASANLKQVTAKADTLLEKITGVTKKGRPHLPPIHLLANVSEQINPGKLRLDGDARLFFTPHSLLDVGIYDLGETSRLNLQFGNVPAPNLLTRYGIYAGKLGVGMEYQAPLGIGLRADLYDANHPRLDVRTLFRVNKSASLWVGADHIFHRASPIMGIQFYP